MKMNDSIDMKGRLTLRLENANGETVQEIAADNDIMLTGRDLVAKLLTATAGAAFISSIGVGTGVAAIDVTHTKLEKEIVRKKFKATAINPESTADGSRIKLTVSADLEFNEAIGVLTEAAIFNSEVMGDGVMYNRVRFEPVTKTKDFKLTLVWDILL